MESGVQRAMAGYCMARFQRTSKTRYCPHATFRNTDGFIWDIGALLDDLRSNRPGMAKIKEIIKTKLEACWPPFSAFIIFVPNSFGGIQITGCWTTRSAPVLPHTAATLEALGQLTPGGKKIPTRGRNAAKVSPGWLGVVERGATLLMYQRLSFQHQIWDGSKMIYALWLSPLLELEPIWWVYTSPL